MRKPQHLRRKNGGRRVRHGYSGRFTNSGIEKGAGNAAYKSISKRPTDLFGFGHGSMDVNASFAMMIALAGRKFRK